MKGRNYFSRADYVRYQLPKGKVKVCEKASDAIAYLYTGAKTNDPCAVVFHGTQAKPIARFRYRSELERERNVKQYFEARQQHAETMRTRAAERKSAAATTLFEVGKTYHDSSSCDWDTVYSFEIVGRPP